MAQYKKRLKSKVLNTLVLVKNLENIRDLINKVVKINNKIYQREQANKGHNKQIPVHKAPQQAVKQWYKGPKPINFNSTQEF